MIKELQISNFKAFGATTQTIPIKPITLVLGPNSGGKSSVIHSLALTHEVERTGNFDVVQTEIGGNTIDLGGFRQYIHRGELNRKVSLAFKMHGGEPTPTRLGRGTTYKRRLETALKIRFGRDRLDRESDQPQLLDCEVRVSTLKSKTAPRRLFKMSLKGDGKFRIQSIDKNNPLFQEMAKEAVLAWLDQSAFFEDVEESKMKTAAQERDNKRKSLHVASWLLEEESEQGVTDLKDRAVLRDLFSDLVEAGLFQAEIETGDIIPRSVPGPFAGRGFGARNMIGFQLDRMRKLQYQLAKEEKRVRKRLELMNEPERKFDEEQSRRQAGGKEAIEEVLVRIRAAVKALAGLDEQGAQQQHNILQDFEKGDKEGAEQSQRFDADQKDSSFLQMTLLSTLDDLVKEIAAQFTWNIRQMEYLSAIRHYPSRHVFQGETSESKLFAIGEDAWNSLMQDSTVRDRVNRWLSSEYMKTGFKFVLKEFIAKPAVIEAIKSWYVRYAKGLRDDPSELTKFEHLLKDVPGETLEKLVLQDLRTNTDVTARDIGVGVSQLIPILVRAFAQRNHLIAIEEPESQLHPALGAELGDVFIESALGENQNRFILETHSENLILRILRRIRQTTDNELPEDYPQKITPDDVAVLYVNPTEQGSEVIEIPVTEDGEFAKRWPGGFFSERLEELIR